MNKIVDTVNRQDETSDWNQLPFEDACDVLNGYAFQSDDYVDRGVLNFRVVNIKNDGTLDVHTDRKELPVAFADTYKDYLLNADDILLVMVGATRGKIGLMTKDVLPALMNQNMWRIVSKRQALSQEFVYFFLRENIKHFAQKYSEEARGFFTKSHFRSFPITFPSLPEQKAIAYALRTVQQAKEATEKVIAATRQLKQSLMKHLFTYGPVPFDHADKVELKETEIGLLPATWSVKPLKELVTRKITDGTHKTPKYESEGVPFVTVTDIRDGRVDLANCKFISSDEHETLIKRCRPEAGDILLSKVGTLGRVVEISESTEFSIFVQLALIKTDRTKIQPTFLRMVLESDIMQAQVDHNASQSTMKYIGVGKIAELLVPYPTDSERKEIVKYVRGIEEKLKAEASRKTALEALFQSLLQNLMTGSIRLIASSSVQLSEAV